MVKKWGRARLSFMQLLVKLKNVNTAVCLNLNYDAKQ